MSDSKEMRSDAAPFWEGCARGEFLLSRCKACGTFHHLAPRRCPKCLSAGLAWEKSGGLGRLASFTVVHRAPSEAFKPLAPYVLGLVDLEEGPRVMAQVRVAAEKARIGMRLQAAFRDGPLGRKEPVFDPQ